MGNVKIDCVLSDGTRTSVSVDALMWSLFVAHYGGDVKRARSEARARIWAHASGKGGASRALQNYILRVIAKPSLLRRSAETQMDIEDL